MFGAAEPPGMTDELLTLVNATGAVIGSAPRQVCHGNPRLMHAVVHCLVRNREGALLLQRRGPHKDVQPDKWDTSVGGHVSAGESIEATLQRELVEEIGWRASAAAVRFLYRYVHSNHFECELVWTFLGESDGPFCAPQEEIAALRFWTLDEIEKRLGSGDFTPNFEDEYRRYRRWLAGLRSGL
ncbi:MAG: NUDIX domain-containing protein [Planctomycetota bacterium]|nr:NUDIX domain-containing protein [Planctomycetota bacterium]